MREVSGKLEARDNCFPKRGPIFSKTWYINRKGGTQPSSALDPGIFSGNLQEKISNIVDANGDTHILGINGISISTLTTIINAVKSQNPGKGDIKTSKPPAPWRSPEEFAALRAAGKCTRL